MQRATLLVTMAKREPHKFWTAYKKNRKPLAIEDRNVWYEHFSTLLSQNPSAMEPTEISHGISTSLNAFDIFSQHVLARPAAGLYVPFSLEEIGSAIKKLKNNKAPGLDELLKTGSENFLQAIVLVFNKLFTNGVYPEAWATGLIVPLHKKSDVKLSNYRGITLAPVLDKLYAFILHQRLSAWAEEHGLRAECQVGFRKDFMTTDQSFILRTLIESSKANKKNWFVHSLITLGLLTQTLEVVGKFEAARSSWLHVEGHTGLYKNVQAAVRTPQGNTETFQSTMGVKQGCLGCPLSPLLFGLYMYGLEQAIHRSDCQPPEIEGKKISLLKFANDSKIFFSTASGLRKALAALCRFSKVHGLTVSPSKTKIIWFNAKLPVSEWYLTSQKIKVVEEHRDLGLMVQPEMVCFLHTCTASVSKASALCNASALSWVRDHYSQANLHDVWHTCEACADIWMWGVGCRPELAGLEQWHEDAERHRDTAPWPSQIDPGSPQNHP